MAKATQKTFPRYADIASRLEEEIVGLAPNCLLPTEQQLSERFEVSRVTVRGALDMLERSGLVSRLRGRGTIVSPPKVVRRFSPLYTFEEDMASQGIVFVTRLLAYDARVVAPPEIRERLEIPREGTVGRLSLVRLVDARVISHELRYYPQRIAERLQPHQIEVTSASDVLEALVGSPIVRVHWESEITAASQDVAEALEIASRTMVQQNVYTWRVAGGVAAEAGIVSYRIDRCRFRYELDLQHPNRLPAGNPKA